MVSDDVKRSIGQHFVFGFEGFEPNEAVIKLICEYYVGNIIIFKRNIRDFAQIHNLIQNLQWLAKEAGHPRPLLIGIDQENGLTSAFSFVNGLGAGTQFPGAMAMGSTKDTALAEEVSAAAARELRMAGINWVYSPVADVNSDPRNPVIGVRSFGEDANEISGFVSAVSKGIEKEGLAATAKHFPGHGDTHVDSHLALPVITKDLQSIEETELIPFRSAINDGISSVMTGHIALPALSASFGVDPQDIPASLSRGIVTNLLRDKLKYEGVVVTDCLEMDAISAGVGCGLGAVMALQAGTDIVMICHRLDRQIAALEATYDVLSQGTLSQEELQRSAKRVQSLKEKVVGNWESILGHTFDPKASTELMKTNASLSKRAYARTTKWLTTPPAQIGPFDDVFILTPQIEAINPAVDDPAELAALTRQPSARRNTGVVRNTAGPSYTAFASAVAGRAPFSTHFVYVISDATTGMGLPESLVKQVLSATNIVFVTRNAHQERSRWQADVLCQIMDVLARPKQPRADDEGERKPTTVTLLASCAPYDLQVFRSDPRSRELPCLCTYEFTKPALEEAAAKLYGESLEP